MRRMVVLVVAAALAGCDSGYTVGYPELPDVVGFAELKLEDQGNGEPEDSSWVNPGEDVDYPDFGVLEYKEPYGDDHKQCKGYEDPPANTKKIDHCFFEMGFHQERSFKVQYFEDGKPTASQEIKWELINVKDPDTGLDIASIDSKASGTNEEGIASVKVSTEETMGQFALKATAIFNKQPMKPLYFDVVVIPKQVAPLTVKFQHEGASQFKLVKAYLFEQDDHGAPACGALDPTKQLPAADKASSELTDITQSAKFLFPDLSIENPKFVYTIVATGYNANGPVLAFGCDDEEGVVEYGKSKVVTIVLRDVPPKYKGKYEVINRFDMISALPDNIEVVVNIVIDFFNSPTAGLMMLTCVLKDKASVLEDLCKNFFNDPNDPSIDSLTMVGGIVQQVIDSILYSLLKDNVGGDIWFTGKDVGNILRDLEIHSTINLKEEPDSTGYFAASKTQEKWDSVTIQWTLGEECSPLDPDCGKKNLAFSTIGQDVVVASFEARIGLTPADYQSGAVFDQLVIYPHSLNFKYGAFLNFVIEKIVLPMIAGDGTDGPLVDSYEKFFKSLVGGKACLQLGNCCDTFAEQVAATAGDWVKGMIKGGCEMLIPMAAAYLRNFLLSLDASTGDTFTIGTLGGTLPGVAQPCTLYDMNNDQVIDTWGHQEPESERCLWDVKLKLANTEAFFDAEFWGKRQQ